MSIPINPLLLLIELIEAGEKALVKSNATILFEIFTILIFPALPVVAPDTFKLIPVADPAEPGKKLWILFLYKFTLVP